MTTKLEGATQRVTSRLQAGYHGCLPVGLIKTPSQLITGFVIRVDTYTCVLTSRQCLATARQAESALIIFVRDVGSEAQAATERVVSCNLKPKIFFQVVGDVVLCAMDWKALSKCDIEPIEVADKDFVNSHVQVGSPIYVVAHCLGEAQRKVFPATVKDLSYRTIQYDEAIPDGCAGGALLCDGRLVGVHIQNSFVDTADTALILHPLLKGVQIRQECKYEEMKRLMGAISDGNVGTLHAEVETQGIDAVKALHADDGRDLVYMAAYYGSRPCLEYLLRVFGEQECVNKHYKHGMTLGHAAAMRGHVDILDCLLAKGFDVACTNQFGDTLAHMAAGAPHTEVLVWLNKTARETLWKENAMAYAPAHVAATRNHPTALSCLAYDCKVVIVGPGAANSKGQEPLDAARESEGTFAACAVLRKLQASRDRLYKGADTNNCVLPTFSEEFESVYQSNSRPFSRKSATEEKTM